MRFITESEVRERLPMRAAVPLMHSVFADLAAARAQNQPRRRLLLARGSVLHYMAGAWGGYFGAKIYSTHPQHGAHFLFLLYRAEDTAPLAIFEANHLGQIRTGAVSGAATDLLAQPQARGMALIGTGFQARTQLEAVLAVRPIEVVRVWSRSEEKRSAFARECAAQWNVSVEAAATAEDAVRGAEIVVTATSSREPVLEAGWVEPGAHVNAVGSNHPTRRELPADLLGRAALIAVDSVDQARMESGDLLLGLDEEGWLDPKLVELQDVVAGRVAVPPAGERITIFKSNGLAVEDVAAAAYVYERMN